MIKQFIEHIPNSPQKVKIAIMYILINVVQEADSKTILKELKQFKIFIDYITLNRYLRQLEISIKLEKRIVFSEKKSIKYIYKLVKF